MARPDAAPRVGALATALALLVPFAAFAALAWRALVTRGDRVPSVLGWARGWWLALVPLALVALAAWPLHGAPMALLATLALIAAAAPLARVPRRAVAAGGLVALAGLLALLSLERLVAERTWYEPAVFPALDVQRLEAFVTGSQRVATDASGRALVERAWKLDGPAEALVVAFDVRAVGAVLEAHLGLAPAVGGGRTTWVDAPVPLTASWQRVELRLETSELARVEALRTVLRVQGGGRLELRSTVVRAEPDGTARPLPSTSRQRLWYGGPNLVGHTLAMGGLMTAVAAPGLASAAAALALAGGGIALTGSRTAAAVLALCALLIVLLRAPPRLRPALAVGLLVGASAAVALLGAGGLGRLGAWSLDDPNVRTRALEMGDAWQALLSAPLRGVGEGNLPSFAHNMWLQQGGELGLPGLLAVVWWSALVAWLGVRRGGALGAVLALGYLALQVTDDSWRYPGVFLPLLLGIAALAGGRSPPAAARDAGGRDARPRR